VYTPAVQADANDTTTVVLQVRPCRSLVHAAKVGCRGVVCGKFCSVRLCQYPGQCAVTSRQCSGSSITSSRPNGAVAIESFNMTSTPAQMLAAMQTAGKPVTVQRSGYTYSSWQDRVKLDVENAQMAVSFGLLPRMP